MADGEYEDNGRVKLIPYFQGFPDVPTEPVKLPTVYIGDFGFPSNFHVPVWDLPGHGNGHGHSHGFGDEEEDGGVRHVVVLQDHDDCDLRFRPWGHVLRRVQDQGPSSICWALTILSAMEYMLARINPADNELSLQVLIYTLREHLLARNLLKNDACTWRGDYKVPMLEVFRWMMIHGVAKESECKSLAKDFLKSGMTVAYLQDYTVIEVENEELMLKILSDGFCLCATIRIFEDLQKYNYDENSVYEATARDQDFFAHAVVITGFGTTPITKKKFWWIKNSWGEKWGDKGFGRIYRGCDAIHPRTGQRNLNLLIEVIACGVVKEKVLD